MREIEKNLISQSRYPVDPSPPPPHTYIYIYIYTHTHISQKSILIYQLNLNFDYHLYLPQAYHVEEVKAQATAKALSFAREIGVSKAILEGDSLVLIMALADENNSLASFGLLVDDVKELSQGINQLLYQLLYSHTKREGNVVLII